MAATSIAAIRARRVWDSRGRPTVEAEVELAGGARGRAIAPAARGRCLDAFAALVEGYRTYVAWEPWRAMERRTAALLPGLFLARIDGKSPAEYVTDDRDREAVRTFARAHLRAPTVTLAEIAHNWRPAAPAPPADQTKIPR